MQPLTHLSQVCKPTFVAVRSAVASMATILQPAAKVLEPVAAVLQKAHHYAKPALSPTFVNIFIPLSAVLGLVFAIWCVQQCCGRC